MVSIQQIIKYLGYKYITPAVSVFLRDCGYREIYRGRYDNSVLNWLDGAKIGLEKANRTMCARLHTTPEEYFAKKREEASRKAKQRNFEKRLKRQEEEYAKKPWFERDFQGEEDDSNMDYVNDELLKKYQFENRLSSSVGKTLSSLSTRAILHENDEFEGFDLKDYERKLYNPRTIQFNGSHNKNADTSIFKGGGSKEFNYRVVELPNSGLKSINLYFFNRMDINKALKHNTNSFGKPINVGNDEASHSLEYFKKRSAYYISQIIKKMGFAPDIITSPQSSSSLNKDMMSMVSQYFPKGDIQLMPGLFKKNPSNVSINYRAASQLGLTQDDIASVQNTIENWKKDEKVRDYRREIERLKKEIEAHLTHKRGRPGPEVSSRKKQIDNYNELIKANRKRGRDATVNPDGSIKDFQVKSLPDEQRRILQNLFVFNDDCYPGRQYTQNGKQKTYWQQQKIYGRKILVIDDNISSGFTLDDFCKQLLNLGAMEVVPITLGQIPLTAYKPSDRTKLRTMQRGEQ